MKQRLLYLITLVIIIISGFLLRNFWLPYYNYYFVKYDYTLPQPGEDFIVNMEPRDVASPYPFMKNLVEAAFPEYNIIFDNKRKPHLIMRYNMDTSTADRTIKSSMWDAPYITVSGEKYSIKMKNYRRNAPPFIELVSSTPKNDRQLYFPYIVWDNIIPKKEFTANNREKFLVYIASNCIKYREDLFAAIKKRKDGAEALGFCSNPLKKRYPGSWHSLASKYAEYDFVFAMENKKYPGYITEKIIMALRSGAIPIYWGDSKVLEEVFNINPKAYVDVSKFKDINEIADYIVELSNDPDRIAAMRAEPIFKNGHIPEIFFINHSKDNKVIQDAAKLIKEKFLFEIKRNS